MLTRLSIRDVVLIEKLDLTLESGLSVLTGETGAGKSILLDSLGLALGHRSEARLIRRGAEQASVSAAFDLADDHDARRLATDSGVDTQGEDLILRRVLRQDGRTRAFVNDQPISVGLLKQIGATLVEIHGQFETQGLLEQAAHRPLLDAFGRLQPERDAVSNAYDGWTVARKALADAEAAAAEAKANEEFLRHAVDELNELAPAPGEEQSLADQRQLLQHAEQISAAMSEAVEFLTGEGGADLQLSRALGALERAAQHAGGALDETIAALSRAVSETADAQGYLDKAAGDMDMDPAALEAAEERLFALRAAARKFDVSVDGLADLHDRFATDLADMDAGGLALRELQQQETAAKEAYVAAAKTLQTARQAAAARLDDAVMGELSPLKLGNALFATSVSELPEERWSAVGMDRVEFSVATNPGSDPGPLAKIASGGELARFMLALKVILAEADPVPVLVFDEVDAGIGGAVAAAVGERLAALGQIAQVLVVTHSPQVAARGDQHLTVRKSDASDSQVRTEVKPLLATDRREEIARMLSGAEITGEARQAAESLLNGAAA